MQTVAELKGKREDSDKSDRTDEMDGRKENMLGREEETQEDTYRSG